MPPRHTYWTILFGNQPTAFRSAEREELLPTFKQIQAKHPDAVMMWFARGRLWKSPEEARDTFDRPRSDRPRGPKPEWQNRDDRPQGDRPRGPRPEWKDRPLGAPPASPKSRGDEGGKPRSGEGGAWQNRGPKPEWRDKPKGDRPPRSNQGGAWQSRDDRPQGDRPRGPRPEWKDRPRGDRPFGAPPASPKSRGDEGGKPRSGEGGDWQNRGPKPEWRDKPKGDRPPRSGDGGAWRNRDDRPQGDRPRGPRPEWKDRPRGDRPLDAPKSRGYEGKPPASARWPNKAGYGEASPKPRSGVGGDWQKRGPKPEWRDKPKGDRPPRSGDGGTWRNRDDRPPGDRPRGPRPEWKDRPRGDRPPGPPPGSPKSRGDEGGKPRSGEGGKPDWQNRGSNTPGDRPAPKGPDTRGRDWRPGGAHKDPRDRFKVPRDVKRARFKQNLQRERTNPRPPRKKKDDE